MNQSNVTSNNPNTLYKITVYVPESDAETVKTALFDAGAGRIGAYDRCCWQTLGQGQFRPLVGAQPALGAVSVVEKLPEIKVELVCEQSHIKSALHAMLTAHPYEEPAYDVVKVQTLKDFC